MHSNSVATAANTEATTTPYIHASHYHVSWWHWFIQIPLAICALTRPAYHNLLSLTELLEWLLVLTQMKHLGSIQIKASDFFHLVYVTTSFELTHHT